MGYSPRSPEERLTYYFALALGVFVLLAIARGAYRVYHSRPIPFDAAVWRADVGDSIRNKRMQMLDDLIERELLIGLTRDELVDLLGYINPAPEIGTIHMKETLDEWDVGMRVGCERLSGGILTFDPFSIDCHYLVARFDEDGRVEEARVLFH